MKSFLLSVRHAAKSAGIECVGNDFGEDRLLERAGIGVPQVFEEMLEIDSSFSHARILSR